MGNNSQKAQETVLKLEQKLIKIRLQQDMLKAKAESIRDDLEYSLIEALRTLPISQRTELARRAYWEIPEVRITAIGEGLGTMYSPGIVKIVGLGPIIPTCKCRICKEPYRKRSRKDTSPRGQDLQHWLCTDCSVKEQEREEKEWELGEEERKTEREEQDARLEELRTMPYRDYLQTEEWQRKRKQALNQARYKCATCNATNVVLHVHHKSYENRGNERREDLIVLCKTCHELFHERDGVQ